jgi:hypothetical protein
MSNSENPIPPANTGRDLLDFDMRTVDADSAISALREYLSIAETQMAKVRDDELANHEASTPKSGDEDEYDLHCQIGYHLQRHYDEDLFPAMRYSFVVLVHIIFENHLRAFCAEIQKDRGIAMSLSDVNGKPIERARTFLTKLAALPVGDLPAWQQLRNIQKVRDCIVHAYGHVSELHNDGDRKSIEQLVNQNIGITIDETGRLMVDKVFCEWCLSSLEALFHGLFTAVGWYPAS